MNLKKQQIINAAYSLFINKGYNSSSIQDILDEAGVSKGTFYKYFTSKTECLIAIMESIGSEIRQKRMAAAVGKSVNDSEVLAEQLCIRIRLNREKNLFSLYESIFHSQDEELKKFAKETYINELNWIKFRITEVFGEEAEPYALENAAVVHGSIQQLTHIWKLSTEEDLPTDELASFVIRRLKAAITQQIKSGDRFIREASISSEAPAEKLSLEELSKKLKQLLQDEEEDTRQLINFLAEELVAETPRKVLMESVLSTLTQTNAYEHELVMAFEQVWKELQQM
ncbi:TetR/AcrR family transcriptional regulator [Planococcus shenhongbingii]|uniref:TetR/AcrR family transcriptional regulator n=1 Tax=Planococcus shenhongbingii TaxID=3058398 RepID=A0ABT8NHP6_9BACL|nr:MULTISPECIES: TetR/AcrR family transcriptional regulator [unclassified Planococcus (in: firmicutes)]MDN7247421.1 TetR/AcrR family transcriptional regulator [Planococcus sp. N017]WKA59549.1 TetR/AcrR family transcriptional regulator [Planococcus sp. N016]